MGGVMHVAVAGWLDGRGSAETTRGMPFFFMICGHLRNDYFFKLFHCYTYGIC